jgi:SAM-dependent methyltransferase
MEPLQSYILDPENVAEMARLEIQGLLLTESMGGLLPEWGNTLPTDCRHILDLGCGPGEWVRQLAQTFPQAHVIGLDISRTMIAYAQALTQDQHLENASFVCHDVRKPLPFPAHSLDLVNARLMTGVLQRDRWPAFLQQCRRVLKPEGTIRLTEGGDPGWRANTIACQRMLSWLLDMIPKSGYGFATGASLQWRMREGLSDLLREGGWNAMTLNEYTLDFSFGTPFAASQRRNILIVSEQSKALLVRLGLTTEEAFAQTYQAMKREMEEPGFQTFSHFLTLMATSA